MEMLKNLTQEQKQNVVDQLGVNPYPNTPCRDCKTQPATAIVIEVLKGNAIFKVQCGECMLSKELSVKERSLHIIVNLTHFLWEDNYAIEDSSGDIWEMNSKFSCPFCRCLTVWFSGSIFVCTKCKRGGTYSADLSAGSITSICNEIKQAQIKRRNAL